MSGSPVRYAAAVFAAFVAVLSVGGALGFWQIGEPAVAAQLSESADGSSDTDRQADRAPRPSSHLLALRAAMRSEHTPAPPDADAAGQVEADRRKARTRAAALPQNSGHGRRVVVDLSEQRVWLVRKDDSVLRSYLVSGSKHDILEPGRYKVYSRSRHAVSYTLEETMQYMVRFARGKNAAIGFHDIPIDSEGAKVQTVSQLGEPLSAGCLRQKKADAKENWRFAQIGTPVVVLG